MDIRPIPDAFFPALAIYFIAMAFLGWLSAKKTDSIKEFLTMGGTAGALVAGFAYLSTQFSMSTFMGVPGAVSTVGWALIAINMTLAFGLWLPTCLAGARLSELSKTLSLYTLPDYLESRYYSKTIRLIVSAITVIFVLPTIGAQTIGAGAIWRVFTGQPEWIGIALMAGVVTLYCLTGGIRGAMLTDVAQAALMLVTAVTIIGVVVATGGGFGTMSSRLAALDLGKMSFPGSPVKSVSYQWFASNLFLWTFFTLGLPQLVTKFFAMKNYETAVRSSIYAGLGMALSANLIQVVGCFAPVILGTIPKASIDYVVPIISVKMLPAWLASVMMAGLLAAGMSTIDSMLVVTSGSLVRDIYFNFINPKAEDHQLLSLIRWVTLACGVAAFLIGVLRPATIFQLILFTFGGLGVLAIPVLLGVRWKRATREGALAGIVVGEVYHALATKVPALAFKFHPGVPALAITLVVMVVVSLMTPPPPLKVLKEHYS